jgi:hypothetical protein
VGSDYFLENRKAKKNPTAQLIYRLMEAIAASRPLGPKQ